MVTGAGAASRITVPRSSSVGHLWAGSALARRFLLEWLWLSATATLFSTVFDAALLQRKRSYFTGGFLSIDHATGWADRVAFAFGSLTVDAAVLAPLVALALWVGLRLNLRLAARCFFALLAALSVIVVWDFAAYSLLAYLGDAFDLSLMFELTNRSPSEFLAVASSHLLLPALVVLAGCGGVVGMTWALQRYAGRSGGERDQEARPAGLLLLAPVLPLLIGLGGGTALRLNSEVLDNGLKRKPAGQALSWVVNMASDFDRDGYGLLNAPADPDPWDAAVYPFALDVSGNGIDEDGVGGDLPAGAPYVETVAGPGSWANRPNVVLIVLESFRADVVGAVHKGKPVTPVLNALAARGISSGHAYSHNGYTVQSRHHIFSGSLANLRAGTTLIDDFKANGYQVAYFSSQDESFGRVDLRVGFDRADVAYDARVDEALRYSTFTTPGSLAVPFTVLQRRIGRFLSERKLDGPLFLYVNLHDTHFPYHHAAIQPLIDDTVLSRSEIQSSRSGELRAMYLNCAANVDRVIGELLREVSRGAGAEPAIIVTADHGESLFEEGFLGHGYALNDSQTRIPFIAVNLPIVVEEPFGQSDLRDALRAAFQAADQRHRPSLAEGSGKAVFQYLGNLHRPRQVGLKTRTGQVVYDFRSGRFSDGSSGWLLPTDLAPEQSQAFRQLVHFWERMRLAQDQQHD